MRSGRRSSGWDTAKREGGYQGGQDFGEGNRRRGRSERSRCLGKARRAMSSLQTLPHPQALRCGLSRAGLTCPTEAYLSCSSCSLGLFASLFVPPLVDPFLASTDHSFSGCCLFRPSHTRIKREPSVSAEHCTARIATYSTGSRTSKFAPYC